MCWGIPKATSYGAVITTALVTEDHCSWFYLQNSYPKLNFHEHASNGSEQDAETSWSNEAEGQTVHDWGNFGRVKAT